MLIDTIRNIGEIIGIVWRWSISNIIYMNIIFSIAIVFFQRRDPKAVWTWLLVLYFIPIVGFILYLIICQDFHKTKMFRTKEIEDALNAAIKMQEDNIITRKFKITDERLNEYEDLILFNLETSGAIYEENNSVDIFTYGNAKFDDMIAEMEKAKKFIHIQYYIVQTDELIERIEKVLTQKIKEGVEVRILYDGIGGRGFKRSLRNRMKKNGIKLGVFFPAYLKRFHLRINYRNHRKIVVIDGLTAYVGGFNIGREYLGLDEKFGYWRDTHLKIHGYAVNDLHIRFCLDWNYTTKENLLKNVKKYFTEEFETLGNTGIQIITSGPDTKLQRIRDNYVRMIHKAKDHIYIQTPYFIPDGSMLQALKVAAYSGVDVKIMIPCKPDHIFVYWATYSYIGELLESGVKCYIYNNGFLHAKGICVDGLVSSYGTANMDIRSFELNFEVNAVIYSPEVTGRLERIFEEDLHKCTEITQYIYDNREVWVRIKEQVSRLLSPII